MEEGRHETHKNTILYVDHNIFHCTNYTWNKCRAVLCLFHPCVDLYWLHYKHKFCSYKIHFNWQTKCLYHKLNHDQFKLKLEIQILFHKIMYMYLNNVHKINVTCFLAQCHLLYVHSFKLKFKVM